MRELKDLRCKSSSSLLDRMTIGRLFEIVESSHKEKIRPEMKDR